jgi:hypothetical protein
MKKNQLPLSWYIENDKSQLFKDTVISYLNTKYGGNYAGTDKYYGMTGKYHVSSLSNAAFRANNYTRLTLQDFIDLSAIKIKAVKEKKYELTRSTILEMASRNPAVKMALRGAFPDAFEPEDKSVNIPLASNMKTEGFQIIRDSNQVRLAEPIQYGEYFGKALFLNTSFNWELRLGETQSILIPTKK